MRASGVISAAGDPGSRLNELGATFGWLGPLVGLLLGIVVFVAVVWVTGTLIMEYVPWLPWLGLGAGIVCGILGFVFDNGNLGATGFGLGLFSVILLFMAGMGEVG